jgi:hypothetical protein
LEEQLKMKKLFVVAGVAVASMAAAQEAPFSAPDNLGIRLGYVLPIDSNLRDVSKSFIGAGLDFPVHLRLLPEGETIVSVDWIGKSGSGDHGNIFPFMISQRFYAKSEAGALRNYGFIGGGVALIDVASSNAVLAFRAGYGVELGANLYGEATFLYTDSSAGVHGTSVGFYLGYRF